MGSAMQAREPEEEGSTAFTLAVVFFGCLVVVGLSVGLFFLLGHDGGIIVEPFSRFHIQPQ